MSLGNLLHSHLLLVLALVFGTVVLLVVFPEVVLLGLMTFAALGVIIYSTREKGR